MRIKILRNLGAKLPPYKEDEVRDVDEDEANLLIGKKLAEPTNESVRTYEQGNMPSQQPLTIQTTPVPVTFARPNPGQPASERPGAEEIPSVKVEPVRTDPEKVDIDRGRRK